MILSIRQTFALLLLGPICVNLVLACANPQQEQAAHAYTPLPADERARVLFVLTAASEQQLRNDKRRKTGYFLSEFYEPYQALRRLGHELAIATPEGAPPLIDPEGLEDDYWTDVSMREEAKAFVERDAALRSLLTLEQALESADDWDGLVIPGGQGVMVDLYPNDTLRQLITRLGASGKAVGLICHAPALLVRLGPEGPFRGREVTAISGLEEFYIETFVMGGEAQVRKIGNLLEANGYDYDAAFPKSDHAVRDCNLVTSQNPFSGEAFINEFIPALHDARRGNPCGSS
jgi:putative intracellular protease/amidase